MNKAKWIPTYERMPNKEEFKKTYDEDVDGAEFIVTIDDAEVATTLYLSKEGLWFDENHNLYPVAAWQPMPDAWKGE